MGAKGTDAGLNVCTSNRVHSTPQFCPTDISIECTRAQAATHRDGIPNDNIQPLVQTIPVADDFVVGERAEHGTHDARARAQDVFLDVGDLEAGFVAVGDAEEEGARACYWNLSGEVSERNKGGRARGTYVIRSVTW